MSASLVGSEMCIRDSLTSEPDVSKSFATIQGDVCEQADVRGGLVAEHRALVERARHLSQAKTVTFPNNTVAEIQKGPTFHVGEAAAPAGPTGRSVLVQGLTSAENWETPL
eukprot:11995239-Alexandrium_andersonii.AAC.1